MTNKYYFYNGFEAPQEIDINDLTIENNYRGDVTSEVIEEHDAWKAENDDLYNEMMGYYGIYRNPTLEDFQDVNNRVGLDKNTYLDEWQDGPTRIGKAQAEMARHARENIRKEAPWILGEI